MAGQPAPSLQDFPPFTSEAPYSVDVAWSSLLRAVSEYQEQGLELEPDFQRGHVWTEQQRRDFLVFCLRGGRSGRNILLNNPSWFQGILGTDFVLVDGLQRLTSILRFLNNQLAIPGPSGSAALYFFHEFSGRLDIVRNSVKLHINTLPTRAAVLTWYLELNGGGTPHTESEIERVRRLLETERSRP